MGFSHGTGWPSFWRAPHASSGRPCGCPRASDGRVRITGRPVFAPETPERTASKRGGLDKSAQKSLNFLVERSLHTGKVGGELAWRILDNCDSVTGSQPPKYPKSVLNKTEPHFYFQISRLAAAAQSNLMQLTARVLTETGFRPFIFRKPAIAPRAPNTMNPMRRSLRKRSLMTASADSIFAHLEEAAVN